MHTVAFLAITWSGLGACTCLASSNGTTAPNAIIQATCRQLQSDLGADTITMPFDANYTYLVDEPWSATVWKNATCIATPKSTSDTQKIVSVLVASNVPFSIRSGGHSPNPFDANIEAGVLVATDNLSHISYDAGNSLATFGPGLRWDAVYRALDPYNVSLVGGRVMDVGVGGLMLGGGLSYLSDLYGLACDNVVSYEVVLADGSAVTASADQHDDLFWALKGGSNNFGIVTEFTTKTFPIFQVWGGMQIFPLNQSSAILQALYEYQEMEKKDLCANLIINILPNNNAVYLTLVYLKPLERPAAYMPFYNLTPSADYTGFYTLHELMSAFASSSLPRWTWYGNSFEPNENLYQDISSALTATDDPDINNIATFPSGTLVASFQPIDKNVALAGKNRGGNPLGLKAENQLWFSYNIGYDGQEYDSSASSAIDSLNAKLDALVQRADASVEYRFMNDANFKEAVIESYGKDNVQRLREVQKVYDPDLVFQRLVKGGQKLHAL